MLLNYINQVIKDNNITFEGTERNNDLTITFTVAELLRQICLINDNLTSFTKYPDDHDIEFLEETQEQTNIKVGKIYTQEININDKDLMSELNNKADVKHEHQNIERLTVHEIKGFMKEGREGKTIKTEDGTETSIPPEPHTHK